MTVLNEIKARLDALGTLGPIKIGALPASPDVVCAMYEYGGLKPQFRFGILGVGYEKPSVQLVFRGERGDYEGPRNRAEIAFRNLAAIVPGPLGNGVTTEYLRCEPIQSPFPLDNDDNDRVKIAINFYVTKEPS